jgi:hypothetical protein
MSNNLGDKTALGSLAGNRDNSTLTPDWIPPEENSGVLETSVVKHGQIDVDGQA